MVHDLATQLNGALADEEWSPAEIELLTFFEAKELLSKLGVEYSLDLLQDAVLSAKRDANKLLQNAVRQEEVNRALEQFGRSSAAAALRRNSNKRYVFDHSSSTQMKAFVSNSLDSLEAAFAWFSRKIKDGPLPNKVLTEIEKYFAIQCIIELVDRFLLAADFTSAINTIKRLGDIKSVKVKYGSQMKEQLSLIDIGLELKETFIREPVEFVAQAQFGKNVMRDETYLLIGGDAIFRDWMKAFSNEGLIEQIRVGGRFQFRSIYAG